jgi:hypothetical protein
MKTFKFTLLLIVAISFTMEAQTTVLKNKRIKNDTSYTSGEMVIGGASRQASVFVSWNDTVKAVLFTAYKPTPEARWAVYQADTIQSDTVGGIGIDLRSGSVNRIAGGKILDFTLELQATGNHTKDTIKVINVILLTE